MQELRREAEDTERLMELESEDIFECREFPEESHRKGDRVWCRVRPYKGTTEYHEWLRWLCGRDAQKTEVGTRLYLSSNVEVTRGADQKGDLKP
jgi:hypothetical protein